MQCKGERQGLKAIGLLWYELQLHPSLLPDSAGSPECCNSKVGEAICLKDVAGYGSKYKTTIMCLDLCYKCNSKSFGFHWLSVANMLGILVSTCHVWPNHQSFLQTFQYQGCFPPAKAVTFSMGDIYIVLVLGQHAGIWVFFLAEEPEGACWYSSVVEHWSMN